MADAPDTSLEIGQEHPLDPNKSYPEGTAKLIVFDTKYGLMLFPAKEDGELTSPRVKWKNPKGAWIWVRRRIAEADKKPSGFHVLKGPGAPSSLDVIRDTHPEIWEEAEKLMARGESSYTAAKYLVEKDAMCGYSQSAVQGAIARQRQRDLKARLRAHSEHDGKDVVGAQRINILDTMENLVVAQKARFDKMHAKEQQSPLLMESVGKEADRLMNYLGKLETTYYEVGIMARAPKVMKGVIASHELAGVDPVRGARVVTFELTEEELPLIEGIKNELGQYTVPAP